MGVGKNARGGYEQDENGFFVVSLPAKDGILALGKVHMHSTPSLVRGKGKGGWGRTV